MRPRQFAIMWQDFCNQKTAGLIVDCVVYVFVLFIGLYQLLHYPHSPDFLSDITYPDLAVSLLRDGTYQLRHLPQTTLPPGLPLILALVGKFLGFAPPAMFGVIAFSTAFGLVACYEFLKNIENRFVAAGATLLIASSPVIFGFNTGVVFPEMPYFLFSMLALLLALQIDSSAFGKELVLRLFLLSVCLVLAVLIRSVGIALVIGLIGWIAASMFADSARAKRRLKRFVVPVILGVAVQLAWSAWAQSHQVLEWQLPGYPASYVSQLLVKNGQYPELGFATWRDIPVRVERNMLSRAAGLSQLLTGRNIARFWASPVIAGVLILIALGLAMSLRNGGQLYDWYFLCYEFIFLLWPWDYRDRFVIPIVPLACVYLWRGVLALKDYAVRAPKAAGLTFLPVGMFLSLISAGYAFHFFEYSIDPEHSKGDRLQPIAAIFVWGLLAAAGYLLLKLPHLQRWTAVSPGPDFRRHSLSAMQLTAALIFAAILASGVRQIFREGRQNLRPVWSEQSLYPEKEAADWVKSNEPSDAVIMAREPEFVYHYTRQPTVWFPPISDPKVLMDGIHRYHVGLIFVVDRSTSYWLPSEDTSFMKLQGAFSSAFHLVHQGPHVSVYEVLPVQTGS